MFYVSRDWQALDGSPLTPKFNTLDEAKAWAEKRKAATGNEYTVTEAKMSWSTKEEKSDDQSS